MLGQCRLCHSPEVSLQESHIISKMFYNTIKSKSITGLMREASMPNRAVQDGIKIPLLCKDCEELFSKYETWFSNEIYQKTIQLDGDIQFDTDNGFLSYFLLSIAWRIVSYAIETEKISLTKAETDMLSKTVELWREWLYYEKIDEIKKVQQFIIPTKNLPFFENIPLRITDMTMCDFKTFDKEDSFEYSFTITQVPYFIFITTVWGHTPSMQLFQLGQFVKAYKEQLPNFIDAVLKDAHYGQYFKAYNDMSDKQKKIIQDRVDKRK